MIRLAAPLFAGLVMIASSGLARAEVLTTPGYSERDTPADLPSSEGDRKLDLMIDVQAQSPTAQSGQSGARSASGMAPRQLPQRLRYRVH